MAAKVGQASGSSVETTPQQLVSRFYTLKSKRDDTYESFEKESEAFFTRAPNYNVHLYKPRVDEMMETLRKIKDDILSTKQKFSEQRYLQGIALAIENLELIEDTKLKLVTKLQYLRLKQIGEPSENLKKEIDDIKNGFNENRDLMAERMEEFTCELRRANLSPAVVKPPRFQERPLGMLPKNNSFGSKRLFALLNADVV